jgi:hypothetical protein
VCVAPKTCLSAFETGTLPVPVTCTVTVRAPAPYAREHQNYPYVYLCGGGNAAVLGVVWPLLLEAFSPRLASVSLPL